MLAARRGARPRRRASPLTLWQGGSYDLTPGDGAVPAGDASGAPFTGWTVLATLAMLDRIVAPGGAVALFHDAHPRCAGK